MEIFRVKAPFTFTIFGASGDLAKLKIFPALFALAEQKRFPKKFAIIGYSRTAKTDTAFRQEFANAIKTARGGKLSKFQQDVLKDLVKHVYYFPGQYDNQEDFAKYKGFLGKVADKKAMQIAYFSVPPHVFEPIVENLAAVRSSQKDDIRLILEKPFGHDEQSATRMFHFIAQFFEEKQVYLLDHYLGKKAVRSLIPLRHMNRILNLMLKGREVANIQISALETVGVDKRIGYFDQVGAVKDMMQSHLLQLLALLTMSIPVDRQAERVQEEKTAILSTLEFEPRAHNVSIGQYQEYRSLDSATKGSTTPTFAALKLAINRETWHNVPIFLRTGKKLGEKHTYIVIELKKFAFQPKDIEPNRVVIELHPDEKIHIRLLDEDGATARMGEIGASESIACFGDYCLPSHGLLLLDVIRGEKTHFLSFAEILASWRVIDRVQGFIDQGKTKLELYAEGSCGPKSQQELFKGTDFHWYDWGDHNKC